MNEVEKMYTLANIKAINIAEYGSTYIPNSVEIDGKLYPPFTAEKQLELIKWLSDISSYFSVHYDRYKGMYNVQTCEGGLYVTNNLSEAIASRVNIIWNDLSEKQRIQIKNILE